MEFIRGLGKFFGTTIFTTFLVFAILLMELASFTSYDNFKSFAGEILKNQLLSLLNEQNLNDFRSFLVFQCLQTDRVNIPVYADQSVVLKCDDVRKSDATQLPTLITNALVSDLYYKDYKCSFVDCLTQSNSQNLLVIASNEGNQFYRSLQMYAWIGTGVGLVILLVSIGTWAGRLNGVGFNLVITGLPFLLFGYIQSSLMTSLPSELKSSIQPIVDSLFTSIKNKFIIVLAIGIILLVTGFGLRFYLSRKVKKK